MPLFLAARARARLRTTQAWCSWVIEPEARPRWPPVCSSIFDMADESCVCKREGIALHSNISNLKLFKLGVLRRCQKLRDAPVHSRMAARLFVLLMLLLLLQRKELFRRYYSARQTDQG